MALVLQALAFAARKHRDQRRKDANASPYINHPIALANVLMNEAGVREFSPAFARDAMVRAESESFLKRVFKGAAQPLLVHFATRSNLSAEEIDQLKQLLDESVKRNPRRKS